MRNIPFCHVFLALGKVTQFLLNETDEISIHLCLAKGVHKHHVGSAWMATDEEMGCFVDRIGFLHQLVPIFFFNSSPVQCHNDPIADSYSLHILRHTPLIAVNQGMLAS